MRWLRLGRGLAVVHAQYVAQVEPERTREAVLDACVHFTGYDPQGEDGRAPFLFDVLVATGLRDALEPALFRALEAPAGDERDLQQLIDLVELFAFDGSADAVPALAQCFRRHGGGADETGSREWVRVGGPEALLEVARVVGCRLQGEGTWTDAQVLDIAEAHWGLSPDSELLASAARREPVIRRYVDSVAAQRERWKRVEQKREPDPLPFPATLEGLVGALPMIARTRRRFLLWWWCREAAEPERIRAAEALSTTTDTELRRGLLRAFAHEAFPGRPGVLLEATRSDDGETAAAAWRALMKVQSEEVRAFSLERLQRAPPDLDGLKGLVRNMRPEDVPTVAGALAASDEREDLHDAFMRVLDVADEQEGAAWLSPLLWDAFEREPCSSCRHSAFRHLRKLGALTPDVVWESRFDAELDLRADAHEAMRLSSPSRSGP